MQKLQFKIITALAVLVGFAAPAQADLCNPCNFSCSEIEIGVDWLYWTTCISNQEYAIVVDPSETGAHVTKKYLCDDWDSGVRVYGKIDNIWNGFNGALIYTYFNPNSKGSTEGFLVFPATSFPTSIEDILQNDEGFEFTGNSMEADWELKYQSIDAVLSYDLNVSCNPCLEVAAFSGLTWVSIKQKRNDLYERQIIIDEIDALASIRFDRHFDCSAIGPTFGLSTSYKLCDCLNIFGTFQTSLVVGENKNNEIIYEDLSAEGEESITFTNYIDYKDKCFCFPGLHLLAGVDYEACICNFNIAVRLGWEYVQWINAPTFSYYELEGFGSTSAPSNKNLTMQGIFLGLNTTF